MKVKKKVEVLDCKKAENLIMKYMDGELSPEDAQLLNNHIKLCEKCREEFFVFDAMMQNAAEVSKEVIRAPEGFEKAVMSKIHTEEEKQYAYSRNDRLRMICISIVLCFFAAGYFLIKNKEALIAKLYEYPAFAQYLNEVVPFSQNIQGYENSALNAVEGIFSYADRLLSVSGMFLLSFIVIGVCIYGVLRFRGNRHR